MADTPAPPPPGAPNAPPNTPAAAPTAAATQSPPPAAAPAKKKVARRSAKAAQPAPAAERKPMRFRAVAAPIHHPYQNITVPVSGSVVMEPDNWVEVQLAAKVIAVAAE
jgi:hypothetical protein